MLTLDENAVNINIVIRSVAREVGKELVETFETAIQNFYSDYKPVRYRRTGSLPKAMRGLYGDKKYVKQIERYCYGVGILIDSSFIPGEPYEKDPMHGWPIEKDEIFERAYVEGIHGFHRGEIFALNRVRGNTKGNWIKLKAPKKSKPPISYVRKKARKIISKKYLAPKLKNALENAGNLLELK